METDYANALIRKKPIPLPIPREQIAGLPGQFQLNDLQTSLLYFLYLTGARISEALHTTTNDLTIENDENGQEALIVRLLTLKKRKETGLGKIRNIPIPLDHEPEKSMAESILTHRDYYTGNHAALMYPVHRSNAFRWMKKVKIPVTMLDLSTQRFTLNPSFATHPHYYRHTRLTHLVTYNNYDILRLKKFAGWSSYQPAEIYVSLNWRDLLEKMR